MQANARAWISIDRKDIVMLSTRNSMNGSDIFESGFGIVSPNHVSVNAHNIGRTSSSCQRENRWTVRVKVCLDPNKTICETLERVGYSWIGIRNCFTEPRAGKCPCHNIDRSEGHRHAVNEKFDERPASKYVWIATARFAKHTVRCNVIILHYTQVRNRGGTKKPILLA